MLKQMLKSQIPCEDVFNLYFPLWVGVRHHSDEQITNLSKQSTVQRALWFGHNAQDLLKKTTQRCNRLTIETANNSTMI